MLLTTQQLAEAEEIATRVVLLARAASRSTGTVAEIRRARGDAGDAPRAATPAARRSRRSTRWATGVMVYVEDADAFVADLVRSGVAFSELEVVPVSLEDAFVALTGGGR